MLHQFTQFTSILIVVLLMSIVTLQFQQPSQNATGTRQREFQQTILASMAAQQAELRRSVEALTADTWRLVNSTLGEAAASSAISHTSADDEVVRSKLDLLRVESDATFLRLKTLSDRPFFFAKEDVWHSADYILKHETVARTWMESFLHDDCRMIDIGCNGGYYALTALAYGCRVLAVDAQPRCLLRLNAAATLSGFNDRLSARWVAVSDDPTLNLTVGATR